METFIISTRVSKQEKENFQKLSARLGLSPQILIKAFIANSIECRGLPFPLRTKYAIDMTDEDISDYEAGIFTLESHKDNSQESLSNKTMMEKYGL
jgi:antitoxin component of RelBE/YafQ-DinJ toxin-antitoxin module